MRYVLIFWGIPMGLFWGWYGLSINDWHFGTAFLSRDINEMVFRIYGNILGVDPHSIPPLVAKASVIDTGLIFGLLAFRRRKAIAAWWRGRSAVQELPTSSA